MRDYILYLEDILRAIEAIKDFIKGMSFNDFEADDKTSSAVIRKLEIIGEATKKIPTQIRDKYPNVPWKTMARLRDVLIHGYFGVDLNIVWDAIKKDLPLIEEKVRDIVKNERKQV